MAMVLQPEIILRSRRLEDSDKGTMDLILRNKNKEQTELQPC